MIRKAFFNRVYRDDPERGFSLVEMALVLLAASIVIGGIWVAAEQSWEASRVTRTVQEITKITQNIREYYMNAQKLPWASLSDRTKEMDILNLFPLEMRRNPAAGPGGTPIDHPFNNSFIGGPAPADGSFHIVIMNCSNGSPLTSTCFRIRLMGLQSSSCIRLVRALPVNDTDLGIIGVGVGYAVPLQDSAATMTTYPVAVTPSTAEAWCNKAGANNEVDWDFKLHN